MQRLCLLFLFLLSHFSILTAAVEEFSRGGIHKDPEPDVKKQTTPDCYFRTSEILKIPKTHQWGFSWYSVAMPIFREPIAGTQIGLGSTWINPNNEFINEKMKEIAKICNYSGVLNEPTLWVLFQSMEGSLGWWTHTKFPSLMPKYKLDSWKNFYSYSVSSPGFNVYDGSKPFPLSQGSLGPVYLSNRILIPPDGMPTTDRSSGAMLGVAWYPLKISREWRNDSGNTWTVFFYSKNFKGPLVFHPEEFWQDYPSPRENKKNYGLDSQPAVIRTMASEWGTVPFKRLADSNGVIWSKIPAISFPADTDGRTVLVRDVKAYEKTMGEDVTKSILSSQGIDLAASIQRNSVMIPLSAVNSPYYQEGKKLKIHQAFNLVTFDDQTAFGFQWDEKKAQTLDLPSYFKEVGDSRKPVPESEVPDELVKSRFQTAGDIKFKFETPNWWFEDAEADAKEYQTKLTDKTTVTYRWIRFKDQAAVKALKLTDEQNEKLQKAVEKIHRSCAGDIEFMAPPSKGELVEFDPGLLVTPPEGKEVGWVPVLVRQEIATP